MADILLTSCKYVKKVTNMSDDISDKYLISVVREACDYDLQSIIGSSLYRQLQNLVKTGDIAKPENESYKNLLDSCQIFLAYSVAAKAVFSTHFHMANAGVYTMSDENKTAVDISTLEAIQGNYQKSADFYAKRLQDYLMANKESLPELDECVIDGIRNNLYSAASCPIWLGSVRGRRIRKR